MEVEMSLHYYQRIPMETIRQDTVIPFALYRFEGKRRSDVVRPGDLFSQEIFFALAEGEIQDLYVRREEMDRYLVYLNSHTCGTYDDEVGEYMSPPV